jgi:hypothetical protein
MTTVWDPITIVACTAGARIVTDDPLSTGTVQEAS